MKRNHVSLGRSVTCLLVAVAILSCVPVVDVSAGTIGGFTFETVEGGVRIISSTAEVPHIVIPASLGGKPVVEIGRLAFSTQPYREKLESVTLPEGLLVIGEGAFQYCKALKAVNIPSTVKTIAQSAFQYCPIETVSLPEGLEVIGKAAFRWAGIRKLHLPKSLTSLGAMAFSGCDELYSITVADGHPLYTASGNCLIDGDGKVVLGCAASVIPADGSVVSIGDDAFRYLDLETLAIPAAIKSIGDRAFSECTIQELKLSNGLEKIGADAFDGCMGLENVEIPDSVAEIGDCAFLMCKSLKTVVLPAGLKTMGERAFAHCDDLETVVIPNGVEMIGAVSFSECERLQSVSIPASVKSIGFGAFANCGALNRIFCAAVSKPDGWNQDWLSGCTAEVIWGKKTVKPGDVNGDGRINIADYALVKRSVLQTYTLNEAQKAAADVTGDGRINIADYTRIKRYVLGTLKEL